MNNFKLVDESFMNYVLDYQLLVMKIYCVIIQQIKMIKTNPVTDQFHCHLTSKKIFVQEEMINQERM